MRNELRALTQREMQAAIITLRNASTLAAESRAKFLGQAVTARKTHSRQAARRAPVAAEEDNKKNQIADLVSGVEELLKRQRELHKGSERPRSR